MSEQSSTADAGAEAAIRAADPLLYDHEGLSSIADVQAVSDGVRDFNLNRVMELEIGDRELTGSVEGEDPDRPLTPELWLDEDGWLKGECDCMQAAEGDICRHGVALLCSYAADQEQVIGLGNAQQEAIAERTQRGRREVDVESLGGEPWFGTWRAKSIASSTHHRRSYRVHIRSLTERWNFCTCPDFATNTLGTCKHIEAVLHKISKRPDYARIRQQSAPQAYVYLAWDREDPPSVRLQRVPGMADELRRIVDRWFDDSGAFRGRLPEDLFRFAADIEVREDIELGDDARRHAQRLAETASQRRRAGGIRESIQRSGGRIAGVRARLYPYQVEGVAFLAATGRGLLADDMGLGKTLQAIAAAIWMQRNAGIEKVLVVCPTSLKQQWAREVERFTGAPVQVIQGNAEARAVQYRQPVTFFVVNYELLMRDLTMINRDLCPDLLILDEAQRIKNWRTKVASTVKLIASRYAFVLSGTPLENRLEDLYSLMQVVDPHILGPLWRYLIDFHISDDKGKLIGYRNLSELRRRIAPVMLRRNRSVVSDQLPERIEQRVDLPMTTAQRDLHDGALSAASKYASIAKRRPLTPVEQNRLMAALQSARMACNAAGLVDKHTEGSPKLDELDSLIDELCLQGGLKVVVFSQWAVMTAMVEQRLKAAGVGSVRLHGGVPSDKRGALIDRFRDDPATQVFLSTDAGGTGLNLQNASVLINLDIPWNPAVLDQRIARVHRLGQSRKVQVVLLVAEDSYEQRVLELVGNKRDLFDNVVSPEASEDVVGVSKKALERLIDDLAGPGGEVAQTTAAAEPAALAGRPVEPAADSAPATASEPAKPNDSSAQDAAVRDTIEQLQQTFGPRVEQVLGSGGGLLVVLDQVRAPDQARAGLLSAVVPVALMDRATLGGLTRLGQASPVAGLQTIFDADADKGAGAQTGNPLLAAVRRKLAAAPLLLDQGHVTQAVELLLGALLESAAILAGQPQAPSSEEAAVWLYQQALPQGWLSAEQGNLLLRVQGLARAEALPETLARDLLADVQEFAGAIREDQC